MIEYVWTWAGSTSSSVARCLLVIQTRCSATRTNGVRSSTPSDRNTSSIDIDRASRRSSPTTCMAAVSSDRTTWLMTSFWQRSCFMSLKTTSLRPTRCPRATRRKRPSHQITECCKYALQASFPLHLYMQILSRLFTHNVDYTGIMAYSFSNISTGIRSQIRVLRDLPHSINRLAAAAAAQSIRK